MTTQRANPFDTIQRPFQYTPANSTNVVATYRKFGWTPPSEQAQPANTQGQSTQRAPITSAQLWGKSS